MVWVVATHMCGGSMGEAASCTSAFGFDREKTAVDFASALESDLNAKHGEWLVDCFELPEAKNLKLPQATEAELRARGMWPIPDGHIALDIEKIADTVAEYGDFEKLPTAPDDSEIDAALASILGSTTAEELIVESDCDCDIDYLDPQCRDPEHINPPKGF